MSNPRPPKFRPPCTAEACTEDAIYRCGLCNKHYMRAKRNGTLDLTHVRRKREMFSPIYENVYALRLKANITAAETCRRAGIGQATLNNMRAHDPGLETLRALAAAFNVDYWRLLIPGEFEKELN